jgi:arylsulfatase A-like enzyme
MDFSRRDLLKAGSVAAALPDGESVAQQAPPASKPNIVLIIADQVRWDAIGAYGLNPMDLTPNIDTMAREGTRYRNMFTNQPVCSPSRACMFTGQYPARHGVWKNAGNGIALSPNATTLATECRKAGYSANYIGKWHLADATRGPVPPAGRGGFLDLWEASNELELTAHPYEGDIYDGDGRPMHFQNEYRVDFLTDRAKRFLQNVSKTSPFLLVVSFLEPHQQNDLGRMVAPKGYAERYQNPFVPADLKHFPGNWQEQLPDYYGALKRVDEAVGEIHASLNQAGLDRNTIVVFVSDHGCHFMTRNTEYKRSGHDASIHIPLVIKGPGFSGGREITESVSMVDLMPTLLRAADIPVPATVQGGTDRNNEVFIQMSEFWVARAIRTPEWTYVASAPWTNGKHTPKPNAPEYFGFQLYDNRADPHQLVNLAGRKETAAIEEHLRERLKVRMQEAGDTMAQLLPCEFPYA